MGALGFLVIVGLGLNCYKKRQGFLGNSMADKNIVYGANQDVVE
jgi:hypothetical protein